MSKCKLNMEPNYYTLFLLPMGSRRKIASDKQLFKLARKINKLYSKEENTDYQTWIVEQIKLLI